MDAEVEVRAYGGELDGVYDHALLSDEALALVAEGTRSTDELIHDLHLFNRITVDEDGTVTVEKGASIANREPAEEVTADEDRGDRSPAGLPLVGPSLLELLDSGDTGTNDELELVLSLNQLDWNPVVSVEHELMVAMIEGRVETRRDALTVRHEAMVAREAAGAAALGPLLDALDVLGVEVLEESPLTGSVRVRVESGLLEELVALEGLAHVDEVEEDSVAAGYPNGTEVTGENIDGEEVENLLQTTQFYSAGYYGDSDGYIGLEEGGASSGGHTVRRSHPGFDDGSGIDRWTNCGAPSTVFCMVNPSPDPGNLHATQVASVLLGDLTLGQDSSITLNGEVPRSGVARRALGLGMGASGTQVISVMSFAPRDIHLMNHSGGNDPDGCTGTSSYCQDWNTLYESGVAVFGAAGNNGHPSPASCNVRSQAAAIGVFTVGAFQVDSWGSEIIFPGQSRGGGQFFNDPDLDPDGRTLIDIMGATLHEFSYSEDSAASQQYPGNISMTSGATPTVTGAAALFRDWYLDEVGTDIDAPGLLYANLLLMGDRMDESGGYLNTGFDELTGAGKLRMRMFDHLDGPAAWGDGSFCVNDGTATTIDFAPSGMDSDVDMVKAVIWWYDHRHDSGSSRHDKVDLRLQRYNALSDSWTTVYASTTNDNKQRVYLESPTTFAYRLRVRGRDVTSGAEGCGSSSTRVYYAWMYEDQDRDTGTALDDQIRPEE